jgi:hypothetical protein
MCCPDVEGNNNVLYACIGSVALVCCHRVN